MAILIAVSGGPIDKSDIYDTIVGDTLGAIAIKKGSLYLLVKELIANDYLEEPDALKLTDKGWLALRNELSRVNQQSYILKIRLHTH